MASESEGQDGQYRPRRSPTQVRQNVTIKVDIAADAPPFGAGSSLRGSEKSPSRFAAAVAIALGGASILAALPVRAATETPGSVVTVQSGRVRGSAGDGVEAFKGIPFAAPPVGKLRWRAPQPAASWPGTRDATHFAPNCMQIAPAWIAAGPDTRYAEDCLYLNVWKPAGKPQKRPVLVWIHGGAFINGGSSYPVYDGSAFAKRGIVFVSLNYRLGRLGFFAHPALTAAKEGPLGNYGYADQIAALEWVKRNIAAFGGDPARVTLMGESAGGISVADLLVSPAASGLFEQAIVMSGGGRAAMSNRPLGERTAEGLSAEDVGLAFARSAGVEGDGPDVLGRLRALPAAKVIEGLTGANLKINGEPKDGLTHVGGPIIDGWIKQGVVDAMMRRGAGPHVPVMVGTTSGDLGVPTGQSKSELFAAFGAGAKAAAAAYDPGGQRPEADVRDDVTRDRLLTEPARFMAKETVRQGSPAWFYRFSYVPAAYRGTWKGVPHGADTSFFFGNVDAQLGESATDEDRAAGVQATAYVANFVLGGNPNGTGLPAWREFSSDPSGVLDIGSPAETAMGADPLGARLDLVEASAGAPLVQAEPATGSH